MTSDPHAQSHDASTGHGDGPGPSPAPHAGSRYTIAAIAMMLALLLPFAALLGIDRLGGVTESTWVLALAERKDAAATAAPGPKVLFVGGSSVLFAVDAPALQRDLGLPVINYGVHAGIGVDLIAERAATHIRRGDVVVLAPEWAHFADRDSQLQEPLRVAWMHRFGTAVEPAGESPRLQYLLVRCWANAWVNRAGAASLTQVQRVIRRSGAPSISIYNLAAFDEAGNPTAPRAAGGSIAATISFAAPPTLGDTGALHQSRAGVALQSLATACRERGATLAVMPAVRVRKPGADERAFAAAEDRWLDYARRAGAVVLLDAGQTQFDVAMAYDTEYHLNDEGVARLHPLLRDRLRPLIADRVGGSKQP